MRDNSVGVSRNLLPLHEDFAQPLSGWAFFCARKSYVETRIFPTALFTQKHSS